MSTADPRLLPPASGLRRIARRLLRAARANGHGVLVLAQRGDRRGRSMVVVGDSHAVLLIDGQMPSPRVVRSDPSTTVLYLGPRLLHSVAGEGFPQWTRRLLAARRRSPLARRDVTVVLALGEIDVRCQLAKPGRSDDMRLSALADAYVGQARDLLELLGPRGRVVILSPNPPSATYESAEGYPVVGSVTERGAILARLCAALEAAAAATGDDRLRFLDARAAVSDEAGQLRADHTFDGCHLNPEGSAIVRSLLADLDAT